MAFIRTKKHLCKNGTISTYYYAVEGHRGGGRIRQSVTAYLGIHPSKEAAKAYYEQMCAAGMASALDPLLRDSSAAASEERESEVRRLEAENTDLRAKLRQLELELVGHNIGHNKRKEAEVSAKRPILPH